MPRQRHGAAECERDRALLGWLARFRFVTAELAGERFEVSREKAALRLRRLVAAALVERHTTHGQAHLFSLSRRGANLLGLPIRRPPRTDAQREHELALVELATDLERETGAAVLTEREIRQREMAGDGRYSVRVIEPGRPPAQRWPDLVVEIDGRSVAVELERAANGTARLQRIATAYVAAELYDEIRFLATTASVQRRLLRVADAAALRLPPELARHHRQVTLSVDVWPPR